MDQRSTLANNTLKRIKMLNKLNNWLEQDFKNFLSNISLSMQQVAFLELTLNLNKGLISNIKYENQMLS